jgi:Mn-dependent DtxR family transcriptional regulator
MSTDASILRALLRLSRRREAADVDALVLRSGESAAGVRAALRRLEKLGLVEQRLGHGPRLTMQGLATAVALLPPAPAKKAAAGKRASRAA